MSMDEQFQVVTCQLRTWNNWDSLHWYEAWRWPLRSDVQSDQSKQQMEQNQLIQWMIRIQQYSWENFAIWLGCQIQLWLENDWLYFQVRINWKIPLKNSDCLGWNHMSNPWPVSGKQRWSTTTSTSIRHTGWRGRKNCSPYEVMPYSQKKGEEQGRKQTTLVKS